VFSRKPIRKRLIIVTNSYLNMAQRPVLHVRNTALALTPAFSNIRSVLLLFPWFTL
jgi:hypothetical protein